MIENRGSAITQLRRLRRLTKHMRALRGLTRTRGETLRRRQTAPCGDILCRGPSIPAAELPVVPARGAKRPESDRDPLGRLRLERLPSVAPNRGDSLRVA